MTYAWNGSLDQESCLQLSKTGKRGAVEVFCLVRDLRAQPCHSLLQQLRHW